MIYSMTGFGRGEARIGDGSIITEVTSLNSRYLEITVRGLREQGELELFVRDEVSRTLCRGKVSVQVVFSGIQTTEKSLVVDFALAKRMAEEYSKLAYDLGTPANIPTETFLLNASVFTISESGASNEGVSEALVTALRYALDRLLIMRADEGKRLADDIRGRFADIAVLVEVIKESSNGYVAAYRERLKKTAEDLLQNGIDAGRLEQELVLYADRADITEELTRLRSHLEQIGLTINEGGRVGRRLDFIIQEINRELNTIGSKSFKSEITNAVVKGKDLLEQIREQVQNIE